MYEPCLDLQTLSKRLFLLKKIVSSNDTVVVFAGGGQRCLGELVSPNIVIGRNFDVLCWRVNRRRNAATWRSGLFLFCFFLFFVLLVLFRLY